MHSPPSHPWILIGNSKLLPTKVSALIKIEELECVCVCVCVCRGRGGVGGEGGDHQLAVLWIYTQIHPLLCYN